ncbi:hypothetical protein [Leifsonia sp. fls2-241-R2A-40a]|uniref:hypothetical protein n=1 Tax=Leifsonia sp. fls2-241-R2A-40a TaxID=3040290 RepID=UPI0025508451|nr:hypothetical protein [Leifsonia sp. fls2-241-R2A-40a]
MIFRVIGGVVSLFGLTDEIAAGWRFAVAGSIISVAAVCIGIFTFWWAWTS